MVHSHAFPGNVSLARVWSVCVAVERKSVRSGRKRDRIHYQSVH